MIKRKLAVGSCIFSAAVFIFCLSGINIRLPSLISQRISDSLTYIPNLAAQYVTQTIKDLYSEQSSVFMQSLLLGDKSDFYTDVALKTAMSRAGIMHVIAVSGMHICFIIDTSKRIFGNSRRTALILLPLIWFFVLMTGATPSAVRAGFMQSMAVAAMLFKRENDIFTTLSFALAVILFFSPDSCTSVSLQLSFTAVAGMLLFSDRIYNIISGSRPDVKGSRFFSYIFGVIASSVSVMLLTVPLTAYHFGSVQILSPLSNIFILPAVSLCFCTGYASVLLYSFLPFAAKAAACIADLLCRYIGFCATAISDVPFASLYISNRLNLLWVVSVYLVILCCFFLYRKKFRNHGSHLALCAFAYAVVSLFAVVIGTRHYYSNIDGCFTAVDVGQGQSLAVISGDETVVIDCGSSNYNIDSGQRAGEYLLGCGRSRINLLLLTHLHSDHVNGVPSLLEYVKVDEIVLSKDASSDEENLNIICQAADNHGTRVTFLTSDSNVSIGDINLELYSPPYSYSKDDNEACISSLVSIGQNSMLVTGDSPSEYEKRLCSMHDFSGTDVLIAGHHGSKNSTSDLLLDELGAVTAIVSVGPNRYSHPSDEALLRLKNHGCSVFRTDEAGSIELILGD